MKVFVWSLVEWVKGRPQAHRLGALVQRQDPGQGPAGVLPGGSSFSSPWKVAGMSLKSYSEKRKTNGYYSDVCERS